MTGALLPPVQFMSILKGFGIRQNFALCGMLYFDINYLYAYLLQLFVFNKITCTIQCSGTL